MPRNRGLDAVGLCFTSERWRPSKTCEYYVNTTESIIASGSWRSSNRIDVLCFEHYVKMRMYCVNTMPNGGLRVHSTALPAQLNVESPSLKFNTFTEVGAHALSLVLYRVPLSSTSRHFGLASPEPIGYSPHFLTHVKSILSVSSMPIAQC